MGHTPFTVLARDQSVHRDLLIEASAGTGKTFAIENSVVRLLIEIPTLPIESILVVTFTKAATKDLKQRIRATLERGIILLKEKRQEAPDYLLQVMERGEETVKEAIRLLERALFSFDQAPIYTIHGFCWNMLKRFPLEAHVGMNSLSFEESSNCHLKWIQGIRDFLRTEVATHCSAQQLKLIIKMCRGDEAVLETKILQELLKGTRIIAPPPFSAQFLSFQEALQHWRKLHLEWSSPSAEQAIIDDLLLFAEGYKGLHNKEGEVKGWFVEQVHFLASLLVKDSWQEEDLDRLIAKGSCLDFFHPHNKKKKKSASLHNPEWISTLQKTLHPIVKQVKNTMKIFLRIVFDCQIFLTDYLEREEVFGHQDLLIQMRRAVRVPSFAKEVRTLFLAAIIDEFQDTDPLQWSIFSSLFLDKKEWKGYLQLVGDPKQSIYAFRQADIYTYLDAAKKMGDQAVVTLDTNYRSTPSLVDALNLLFKRAQDLFPLPRLTSSLAYLPIKAGRSKACQERDPPLQFLVAEVEHPSLKNVERSHFFPAIATELLSQEVPLSRCAILVADRYQAERLINYLQGRNIPVRQQRGKPLTDSIAVDALKEVIEGVLHSNDLGVLYKALAGKILGWSLNDIEFLKSDCEQLLAVLKIGNRLKSILEKEGFASFHEALMESSWLKEETVRERLLKEKGGLEFYREWQDLIDLIVEENTLSSEGIIDFLTDLKTLNSVQEEGLQTYVDHSEEGVVILTTHVSKGLEFDVVFTLGSVKTMKTTHHTLVTVPQEGDLVLHAPLDEDDEAYQHHLQECDAEKMRQLYVAMTRAKLRLYVPVIIGERKQEAFSPVDLLLSKLGVGALDELTTLYPSLIGKKVIIPTSAPSFIEKSDLLMNPIEEVNVPYQHVAIHSFTSLTKHQEVVAPQVIYPVSQEKTAHTLPKGKEIGVLFHEILENIDFASGESQSQLQPLVRRMELEGWEEVIAHIIDVTLSTPLPGPHGGFCLKEVKKNKQFREIEFLYGDRLLLKGVIDLLFEHEGMYYLVDWKTNWLGPDQTAYTEEKLHEAMEANSYYLQAEIYQEALKRYVQLFDTRPFEELFGGVYYLFLRGISPSTGILLVGPKRQKRSNPLPPLVLPVVIPKDSSTIYEDQGELFDPIDRALAGHYLGKEGTTNSLVSLAYLSAASRLGHLCICTDGIDTLVPPLEEVCFLAQGIHLSPAYAHSMTKQIIAGFAEGYWEGVPIQKKGENYYLEKYAAFEEAFLNHFSTFLTYPLDGAIDLLLLESFLTQHSSYLLQEQQEAIRRVCSSLFTIVSGGPGTGKTYTMGFLLSALKSVWKEERPFVVALAAPTGKAAANLDRSIRKVLDHLLPGGRDLQVAQAKTLHQLLSVHKKVEKLTADLLIVDEASMIDICLMTRLFASVKPGTRVVLLGDPHQLPPVDAGAVFSDIVQGRWSVELKTCMRTEAREILRLAQEIKEGGIPAIVEGRSVDDLIRYTLQRLPTLDDVATDPRGALKRLSLFQLLSPLRQGEYGSDALNRAIHGERKRLGASAFPILITKNDYRHNLFNGEIGILLGEGEEAVAFFPARIGEQEVRKIPNLMLPPFEFAYALSVHKSQGSEFDHVVLVVPKGAEVFGRSALYTGVTRARQRVEIWSDSVTIEKMSASFIKRQSGIREPLAKFS